MVNMNPMTAKSFGMASPEDVAAKKKFDLRRIGSRTRRKLVDGSPKKDTANKVREKNCESPPKVKPATMTDEEVKRRTGFKDRNTLLAYIVVICNGDWNRVRKRCTVMTWFEE